MGKKDDTQRRDLAMKIMLLKFEQIEGLISLNEALKEAVDYIKAYEKEYEDD
jgi:hypothetical protein